MTIFNTTDVIFMFNAYFSLMAFDTLYGLGRKISGDFNNWVYSIYVQKSTNLKHKRQGRISRPPFRERNHQAGAQRVRYGTEKCQVSERI